LAILAARPGQLVTREELKNQIWGQDTFVDFEHGLNLCIRQIREVLNDNADTPRYLETLPRRGYRFIAPVQAPATEVASEQPPPAPAAKGQSPVRRIFSPLIVVAALVLVTVGALTLTDPGQWREKLFGGKTGPVHTIAVLPLLNLSGDANQDYFADGITEALTTDLARMETVQVISRSSTMQYKGAKKPLPEIAGELHADAVVEGSVQRVGNRVRVTAQLIRAATDRHLWADTYERNMSDILALQDDVSLAIAAQIQLRLNGPQPRALGKAQAVNPEAYETYLKANYYFGQFDLQKSVEYYNQAIKLDPNYAPAYASLADVYFFLGFFGAIPPQQAWGKVKEVGLLAVQKDDQLPKAHAVLAQAKLHYDWDFAGAEREYKRALELNPNDADILHDYAHYLMAMGRMDESTAETKRALELDPVDDDLTDCLCWHSYAARQYDSSIQMALEMLKRQPNDSFELTILGWDYEQKGMHSQAVAQLRKALELDSKDSPMHTFLTAGLGQAYAIAGMKSEARQVLHNLLERARQNYVSPFDIALIYTALGDKEAAFDWLNKAESERSTFLVYSKWEPRLDPLRSDPRFQKMLKEIGLT
jgi:TolB-like protein/DNA-binding winged helix-turn-helix (wHTH) protein/Tfp pilus assembly protein PilF